MGLASKKPRKSLTAPDADKGPAGSQQSSDHEEDRLAHGPKHVLAMSNAHSGPPKPYVRRHQRGEHDCADRQSTDAQTAWRSRCVEKLRDGESSTIHGEKQRVSLHFSLEVECLVFPPDTFFIIFEELPFADHRPCNGSQNDAHQQTNLEGLI